jgi:hypothetical protein
VQKQPRRNLEGIKPCIDPCNLCLYINTFKEFCSSQTKVNFETSEQFNYSVYLSIILSLYFNG